MLSIKAGSWAYKKKHAGELKNISESEPKLDPQILMPGKLFLSSPGISH